MSASKRRRPSVSGVASRAVVITPNQAHEIDVKDPVAEPRVAVLSTEIEARVDAVLLRHGRAVVASRPVQGALLAAAEVVYELERRYRRAGWATALDGATLTVMRPT